MNLSSKLNPDLLKQQCLEIINHLETDNNNLLIVKNSIELFINDSSIQSQSFNSLKCQLIDYLTIIDAIIKVNNSDISDCKYLINIIGNESLDGNIIEAQNIAKDLQSKAKQNLSYANIRLKSFLSINPLIAQQFRNYIQQYETEIEQHQKVINYCQEKIDAYDAIELLSENLFTKTSLIKFSIQDGLQYLRNSFNNGQFTTNSSSSWRKELRIYINSQSNIYISLFYKQLPEYIKQYLKESDFTSTEDGYVMCTKSIQYILNMNGFNSKDELYDNTTIDMYDDWYLAGLVTNNHNITYTLIKMRTPNDNQNGKGSKIPFIEFDLEGFNQALKSIHINQVNLKSYNKRIYDLLSSVIDEKKQESPLLRDYFADPKSQASYMIADNFVDKIIKSGCFINNTWHLNASYSQNDDYAKAYLKELEREHIYNSINNTITIKDINNLSEQEYNAILIATTGNIDVYSFAGENYWHAKVQQIADIEQALPSPADKFYSSLIETHTISSDAGVGESRLGKLYEYQFKIPTSKIYNQQKILHQKEREE